MHNNTLAAAYANSLLLLRGLNGSTDDTREAQSSVAEYARLPKQGSQDRQQYKNVMKFCHVVNRAVKHHILEYRAADAAKPQAELVEEAISPLRQLVEDLGAELQQRLDDSADLRGQAGYYAGSSRERDGRHSLYELATGLVDAGCVEHSTGDLPTRRFSSSSAEGSSVYSRLPEVGNHTLAAAYLSAGWPATYAADPFGPSTKKLAATLQEYSASLSSASDPIDNYVLKQVRTQANEVFAGWHKAQRLSNGLGAADELQEEVKDAFLAEMHEQMEDLSRLEGRLEMELTARLEHSTDVMNEARYFAGAPEGDNDTYHPEQLALGLVKAGVAFEHPGSRTPSRDRSMGL